MLMDTVQMKSLDGIEIPKAKFGRARPGWFAEAASTSTTPPQYSIHRTSPRKFWNPWEIIIVIAPRTALWKNITHPLIHRSRRHVQTQLINGQHPHVTHSYPIVCPGRLHRHLLLPQPPQRTVQHHTCPSLQRSLHLPSTVHHICLYRNHPLWWQNYHPIQSPCWLIFMQKLSLMAMIWILRMITLKVVWTLLKYLHCRIWDVI